MKTEERPSVLDCLEQLQLRTTTIEQTIEMLEALPYAHNVILTYCIQMQRDKYVDNIKPMFGIVEYAMKNLTNDARVSTVSLVLETCGNRNMPTVFEHALTLNDRNVTKILASNPFMKSDQLERAALNKILTVDTRKALAQHKNATFKVFKRILHGNESKTDLELETIIKKHPKYRQLTIDYVKTEYGKGESNVEDMPFSWVEELAFGI